MLVGIFGHDFSTKLLLFLVLLKWLFVLVLVVRSGSASARSRQRVKSAGGWPRAIPMPRCQTAGAGDAASRSIVSDSFKKIQRPKTVCTFAYSDYYSQLTPTPQILLTSSTTTDVDTASSRRRRCPI